MAAEKVIDESAAAPANFPLQTCKLKELRKHLSFTLGEEFAMELVTVWAAKKTKRTVKCILKCILFKLMSVIRGEMDEFFAAHTRK